MKYSCGGNVKRVIRMEPGGKPYKFAAVKIPSDLPDHLSVEERQQGLTDFIVGVRFTFSLRWIGGNIENVT
jgi:hypothetical protein